MTREELSRIEEALERLDVIERRVEVMQVRQEFGQEAVLDAQSSVKEIREDVKILVDRVADNRLENYKAGGIAAVVGGLIQFLSWQARQ